MWAHSPMASALCGWELVLSLPPGLPGTHCLSSPSSPLTRTAQVGLAILSLPQHMAGPFSHDLWDKGVALSRGGVLATSHWPNTLNIPAGPRRLGRGHACGLQPWSPPQRDRV